MFNSIVQRLPEVMFVELRVARVTSLDVRREGRRLGVRQRVQHRKNSSRRLVHVPCLLLLLLLSLQPDENVGEETLQEVAKHAVDMDQPQVNLLAARVRAGNEAAVGSLEEAEPASFPAPAASGEENRIEHGMTAVGAERLCPRLRKSLLYLKVCCQQNNQVDSHLFHVCNDIREPFHLDDRTVVKVVRDVVDMLSAVSF
mmetsp:Transcript_11523/g.26355  ORF Transcript_11523/g.26355 Transcript_11523/m.26355 type:complete len:200 (+) Transcript_11523:1883-2482(+)